MIVTCLLAAAVLLVATLVGSAAAVALSPARDERSFAAACAPLLGMAVLLAVLDVAELWLPLRVGAWIVPVLALSATAYLAKKRALPRPRAVEIGVVLLGLAVGAFPTAIAGRATAVSITNDDATYYLQVAERLVTNPWLEHVNDGQGAYCLSENVVHGWLWRTGVANVMGSIIALARVDGTVAIAAVTAALTGLVAQAGTALAVAFGVRRAPAFRRALPAAALVLSAAPAFLGWQHLLGQLAAFSLLPTGLAALARASTRGGPRRVLVAALLLGAAMNVFADAAVVMTLAALSVLVIGGYAGVLRRIGRAAIVGGVAAAVFPITFWRAAWAAFGTVIVRAPSERRGLFPQRGWLERTAIDDLATAFGVDPWPPWPAPWPPTAASVLECAAVAAAVVLLVAVSVRERRRAGLVAAAVSMALVVAATVLFVSNRYLRAKCLLLEASMLIPAIAAAAFLSPRRWLLVAFSTWSAGGIAALAQLARPSGFHVVDEPDHDRLVGALARVPAGSLLVLDGFGAPTDTVHDEHRAMRAAHFDGLVPIQPGLDGGFFKPICDDPTLGQVPAVGFALQRAGTEAMTTDGDTVEQFGRFTLRKVDLSRDDAFVGTWAPTHGWLRAETEPDGSVFRWAEADAGGTLRAVTRAGCGRLTGEVRSVDALGSYTLTVSNAVTTTADLTPVWQPFRTGVFSVADAVAVEVRAFVVAHDDAHVLALRRFAFVPDASCVVSVARTGESVGSDPLPETLPAKSAYTVVPATGVTCGRVMATIEASGAGGVMVTAGRARSFTALERGRTEASSLVVDFRDVNVFSVELAGDTRDAGATFRVLSLRVRPEACQDVSR